MNTYRVYSTEYRQILVEVTDQTVISCPKYGVPNRHVVQFIYNNLPVS